MSAFVRIKSKSHAQVIFVAQCIGLYAGYSPIRVRIKANIRMYISRVGDDNTRRY